MKAHLGVDANSGLVDTLVGTAANVHDVTQAQALLHGDENDVCGDAGYQGVEKSRKSGVTRDLACRHAPGQTQEFEQIDPG